ncbi:hypothetical protein ACIQWN_06155 [Streptomyces vinaceus]|uniref:hypothetical protein n=1 Tax=Streptomyces vinaceus TaxID=1960 RepID=UPI00381EF8E9
MNGDPNAGDITVRKLPGETREQFIARIVAARPPLTLEEIALLRAIFLPAIEAAQRAKAPDTAA